MHWSNFTWQHLFFVAVLFVFDLVGAHVSLRPRRWQDTSSTYCCMLRWYGLATRLAMSVVGFIAKSYGFVIMRDGVYIRFSLCKSNILRLRRFIIHERHSSCNPWSGRMLVRTCPTGQHLQLVNAIHGCYGYSCRRTWPNCKTYSELIQIDARCPFTWFNSRNVQQLIDQHRRFHAHCK